MRWKVTLSTGLFNQFDEIVEASSSANAKQTALARNPTAKVVSCWPAGGGSPESAGLFFAVFVALGTILAGSLGFIKVDKKPDSNTTQSDQAQEKTESPTTDQEEVVNSQSQTSSPLWGDTQLWGAFAVSPSQSTTGWAKNYPSQEEAIKAAKESCAQSDCVNMQATGPGFSALAKGNKAWYQAIGKGSESEASKAALSLCQTEEPDGSCNIESTFNF
jgi:hypothetical protein